MKTSNRQSARFQRLYRVAQLKPLFGQNSSLLPPAIKQDIRSLDQNLVFRVANPSFGIGIRNMLPAPSASGANQKQGTGPEGLVLLEANFALSRAVNC